MIKSRLVLSLTLSALVLATPASAAPVVLTDSTPKMVVKPKQKIQMTVVSGYSEECSITTGKTTRSFDMAYQSRVVFSTKVAGNVKPGLYKLSVECDDTEAVDFRLTVKTNSKSKTKHSLTNTFFASGSMFDSDLFDSEDYNECDSKQAVCLTTAPEPEDLDDDSDASDVCAQQEETECEDIGDCEEVEC